MTEQNITSLHFVPNTHHKIHLPATVCAGCTTAYCFFLEKRQMVMLFRICLKQGFEGKKKQNKTKHDWLGGHYHCVFLAQHLQST